jgi:hypothetical protein
MRASKMTDEERFNARDRHRSLSWTRTLLLIERSIHVENDRRAQEGFEREKNGGNGQ